MKKQSSQKILGADVFLQAPLSAQLPPTIGRFKFKHISSRGMVVSSASDASVLDVGWICARYLAEGGSDTEILELTKTLGEQYPWTSVIKLLEIDGVAAFS